MIQTFKIASKSEAAKVAGAVANTIREDGKVKLECIGAGALNVAIKAIAIARGYVSSSGIDLSTKPSFYDVELRGEERTGIKLMVEGIEE